MAESSTPEAVIEQMRSNIDAQEQAESSSDGKKEKKKGFFKGLFGGKK